MVTFIVVGVVLLLVVVGGVGAAVVLEHRSHTPVSLPDHVGQLGTLNSPGAQAEVDQLVQQLHAGGSKNVAARIYSADGLTQGASALIADVPANVQRESNVAVSVVDGFTTGFTAGSSSPQPASASPGPNGGYMACGLRAASLESVSFCAWSDGKTISELSDTHGTTAEAHALALEIRAANGH
jgi:hypothetical protein